jgi:NAD-dependent SIR2 family protein deacetylase
MNHLRSSAVFLGAGASRSFGFPLTGELLPEITRRLDAKELFQGVNPPEANAEDCEELGAFLNGLLPGLREVGNRKEWPLITSLLSLIDYSLATGDSLLRGSAMEDTRRIRRLIERALVETIVNPWQRDGEDPQAVRKDFLRWLESRRQDGQTEGEKKVGIITTNYDISVEQPLFHDLRYHHPRIAEAFDFGFTWRDPEPENETDEIFYPRPIRPRYHLYKLHGSLNWLRCSLCGHVYINPRGTIVHQAYRRQVDQHNTCHCGHARLEVQLVSPSFVRPLLDPHFQEVWRSALQHLRESDEWIIVGYSFPDEDLAIRSLFTRALHARSRSPKIVVVQQGQQDYARYGVFFRQTGREFEYFANGLAAWLESQPGATPTAASPGSEVE